MGTKFSYDDSRLHRRFCYAHETTELQTCQGGLESHGHTWERGGHSGGPLCGLLQGGVPVPLAGGVASAQLGRHDTENLRKPLLYALLRLPRPFEAIKYISFIAIARN
jgi:hypothetical protein